MGTLQNFGTSQTVAINLLAEEDLLLSLLMIDDCELSPGHINQIADSHDYVDGTFCSFSTHDIW
jgi:hypothetical protein